MGLIATVFVIGGLGAAALIVNPGAIKGQAVDEITDVPAGIPEHQLVIERLAGLIRGSHALVTIHDRQADPLLDVLLWLEDDRNPGVMDDDEIGLITHSRVTQTIIFRHHDPKTEIGGSRLGPLYHKAGQENGNHPHHRARATIANDRIRQWQKLL